MRSSVLLALAAVAATEVRTPFGTVADGCTLEVPHGTHVDEDETGLVLSHPTLGSWRHEAPAHCHMPRRALRKNSDDNVTCSALPCNNWIDNAGWQQAKGDKPIGGFSATYLVPATPTTTGPGQCLFYFLGAENTDGQPRHGQPPPSGRAILQPVLTYNPDGWCKASKTGWCFSSWYCCPKNITVHTKYIQDVENFDSFAAFFNISTDGATFTVSGTSAKTSQAATLHCPRQGRNFNWADLTLEVYQITKCALFSPRFAFSDVTLWDTSYKELTPQWALSPASPITRNSLGS